MSAHAILGPSSAKRWLTCTPSAALEATFPPTTSKFADEGTLAHRLAEMLLRKYYTTYPRKKYLEAFAEIEADPLYSPEMPIFINQYVDYIKTAFTEARNLCYDPKIFFEKKLDFSEYVPDGWGTGDVIIITDGQMQVIDLKYGKGVPVDAVDNPQCRLYGLGALLEFLPLYDIQTIKTTICQPRLDSISSEELTADELLDWAETFVKPRAKLAAAGEGVFVPGDHCRFCRANATCTARSSVGLAVMDFTTTPLPLLMPEDFASVLDKLPVLEKWVKDFKDYTLKAVLQDELKIPGYKVVEGRSNRKIADPAGLEKALLATPGVTDIYIPAKLKGITDLEKIVGKKRFTELAEPFIIKPAGEPTLAPESDKRPEMQNLQAALKDFDSDIESED